MKVIPPPEFPLKLVRPFTDQTMPQSEIVIRGEPTGKLTDGAILEAAVGWDGCYLAFITDDIPHEDALRICLFDPRLKLIDTATLGAMYSTGSFGHLELSPPNIASRSSATPPGCSSYLASTNLRFHLSLTRRE